MICKLDFLNGEQKECRKVGLEQVPMDKVYQVKAESEVTTLYPYSSTPALLFWDMRPQFGFRVSACSCHG